MFDVYTKSEDEVLVVAVSYSGALRKLFVTFAFDILTTKLYCKLHLKCKILT